ncbi:thiamine pyrophosphate-binding protein [Chloroflexota bacterium]
MTTSKSLTAQKVLDELRKCGITHIVWLPDSEARFMYDAIMSLDDVTLVPICHEAEAAAIAAGLIVGGKKPIVLHQNTGFFEAGDSLRGLIINTKLPLLLMLGYRGWQGGGPMEDTAGIYIEPILDAWGINHYLVDSDSEIKTISAAYKEAHDTNRPVAVLIGKEYK